MQRSRTVRDFKPSSIILEENSRLDSQVADIRQRAETSFRDQNFPFMIQWKTSSRFVPPGGCRECDPRLSRFQDSTARMPKANQQEPSREGTRWGCTSTLYLRRLNRCTVAVQASGSWPRNGHGMISEHGEPPMHPTPSICHDLQVLLIQRPCYLFCSTKYQTS